MQLSQCLTVTIQSRAERHLGVWTPFIQSPSTLWWFPQVLRSAEAVGEHPRPAALPPQRPGGTGPTGRPVQLRGAHPGHGDPVHRLHRQPGLHHQRREQDLPPHHRHLPQVQQRYCCSPADPPPHCSPAPPAEVHLNQSSASVFFLRPCGGVSGPGHL